MNQFEKFAAGMEALHVSDSLRDCLVQGILVFDSNARLCGFNPKAEELAHCKLGSVLGQNATQLASPLAQCVARALATGQPLPYQRVTLPGEIALRIATSPLVTGEDGSAGVVLVLSEFVPVQKLGDLMQRLFRLASIGTLSAGMAHEIKNALVGITTFVGQLLEQHSDSELAGIVSRELRRINGIATHMLKFARPARSTFSPVRVHQVLEKSLRLMEPQLSAKGIKLERSFAAHPDTIQASDSQLEQAFLNVLLNGLAAMRPQGHLTIVTNTSGPPAPLDSPENSAEPQFVQIAITDTGLGISPENLERVFEPFFSTKAQGTGLGLAITRRIVLEHGGSMTVESQLEKGTTFRIWLPLSKVES